MAKPSMYIGERRVIEIAGYGIGRHSTAFAFPINVQKVGRSYRVVYGAAVHAELNYNDACKELGAAIMHALQCDGVFDAESE